jgi:hypothetical protein
MMQHQWLYERGKANEITHHRLMKKPMAKGMGVKKIEDYAIELCKGAEYDFAGCNCQSVARKLAQFGAGQ